MRNIELKAKIDDFKKVVRTLHGMGARRQGVLYQTDVYFNCLEGRLKLRTINNEEFELISYKRSDMLASRMSVYNRILLKSDEAIAKRKELRESLGETVVVEKKRELWIYGNTRIHIDEVKGLGNFIELETVIENITEDQAMTEHEFVLDRLGFRRLTVCKESYSDLIGSAVAQ